MPESVAIKLCNRSHQIAVTLDVPDSVVPNGVLIALGCALGGWSLHLVDGQLRYVHNLYGKRRSLIQADRLLGSGRHNVKFAFEKDGGPGGSAVLEHDGEVVAEGSIDRFTPAVFNEVGDRPDVRLRVGTGRRRRLFGAVRLQWDHPPSRRHRHGPHGGRSRPGGGGHLGHAMRPQGASRLLPLIPWSTLSREAIEATCDGGKTGEQVTLLAAVQSAEELLLESVHLGQHTLHEISTRFREGNEAASDRPNHGRCG